MKKCPNCNNSFSKRQVVRSKWLGYYKLKCSSCGAQYEHTFKERLLVALVPAITIILTFIISNFYNFSMTLNVIIMAGILAFFVIFLISRGFKFGRTN
jgi:CXXC-20-CXXC protein